MKKLVLALALACAPLAGCSALQPVINATDPVVEICSAADRVLIDEAAVVGAQTLYIVAGEAYLEAVNDGHLPEGELRTKIKNLLVKMYSMQNAVRAARGTLSCDFAAMKELHSEVILLIPRS